MKKERAAHSIRACKQTAYAGAGGERGNAARVGGTKDERPSVELRRWKLGHSVPC